MVGGTASCITYNSHIEAWWGQHETLRDPKMSILTEAERTVCRLCMQSWSEYLCQCSVSFPPVVKKIKINSLMSVGWWENIWKSESFDCNILDSTTVENCTFTSVHAHTGTVQIWGWMSWSHFQFLHGCWRRCKEPWRLREKQTFDHIYFYWF